VFPIIYKEKEGGAAIWCRGRVVFRIWGCMCLYICHSYVSRFYNFVNVIFF
jgi:hypothetical protein